MTRLPSCDLPDDLSIVSTSRRSEEWDARKGPRRAKEREGFKRVWSPYGQARNAAGDAIDLAARRLERREELTGCREGGDAAII
jgi:hypothetical protein